MTETEYIILISGMGIVSFLPRWIPLFFLSRKKMPDLIVEWLELIPVSILSALLFPALLTSGEIREFNPFSRECIIAIPTFIFAWYTKSLAGTLVFGMFLYWAAVFF